MIEFLTHNFPLLYLVQPLWRDEAFSALLVEYSLIDIILLTAQDFTPPLYYLLLALWVRVFGNGEIAIRSLSFLFFLLTIVASWYFAKGHMSRFGSWTKWAAAILVGLNPMLVFYAFEARAYELVVLLSVVSSDMLLRNKWKLYVVVSTLMLYTHPYSVLLLASHGLWILWTKQWNLLKPYIVSGIAMVILYIPWLMAIFSQVKRGGSMWFFPVDMQLVNSVLGNMYVGYEGTPWFMWLWTERLSLALLVLIGIAFWRKGNDKLLSFLSLWVFLPIILIVGVSFIRPLFVNRYIIFVTPGLVLLVVCSMFSILSSKHVQKLLVLSSAIASLVFMIWYAPFTAKNDFRTPLEKVATEYKTEDVIVVEDPLYYFNVRYYAPAQAEVLVYKADANPIPQYLGKVLIPDDKVIDKLPSTKTIYFVTENATYETIKQLPNDVDINIQLKR